MRTSKRDKDQIRIYIENQAHEAVVHLEKAASELVGLVRHDIWDVHCLKGRWWVVTNPTNFYDQADFKSRDAVLTFHIGLALRIEYAQERKVPVTPGSAALLLGSWRRRQQAVEAYGNDDEAETFQSVGVRLRECLVSFVGETRNDMMLYTRDGTPLYGRRVGLSIEGHFSKPLYAAVNAAGLALVADSAGNVVISFGGYSCLPAPTDSSAV